VHSFVKHCLTFFLWPLYLSFFIKGPSWTWLYGSWNYNYLCNQCLSPLILWVIISIRARGTALCDKVCQWPATGQWFSPGPPVSCTNKTDRHNITEVLLKVALSNIIFFCLSSTIIWFNVGMYFPIIYLLWTCKVCSVPENGLM
jgi:hypothetical protein